MIFALCVVAVWICIECLTGSCTHRWCMKLLFHIFLLFALQVTSGWQELGEMGYEVNAAVTTSIVFIKRLKVGLSLFNIWNLEQWLGSTILGCCMLFLMELFSKRVGKEYTLIVLFVLLMKWNIIHPNFKETHWN